MASISGFAMQVRPLQRHPQPAPGHSSLCGLSPMEQGKVRPRRRRRVVGSRRRQPPYVTSSAPRRVPRRCEQRWPPPSLLYCWAIRCRRAASQRPTARPLWISSQRQCFNLECGLGLPQARGGRACVRREMLAALCVRAAGTEPLLSALVATSGVHAVACTWLLVHASAAPTAQTPRRRLHANRLPCSPVPDPLACITSVCVASSEGRT